MHLKKMNRYLLASTAFQALALTHPLSLENARRCMICTMRSLLKQKYNVLKANPVDRLVCRSRSVGYRK